MAVDKQLKQIQREKIAWMVLWKLNHKNALILVYCHCSSFGCHDPFISFFLRYHVQLDFLISLN